MSQENEGTLRAFLETITDIPVFVDALKRGDADLSPLDPDVAYEDANLPDHIGETYRGSEGILRAAERRADASEALTLELERIVGSGDRLVSIHKAHSKARHTGIEFDATLAYAWTFRHGRIIHFQSYRDRPVDPTATATPRTYTYPPMRLGARGQIHAFFIEDTSSSVLDVSRVRIVGPNPGDFKKTRDGCTVSTPAAGGGCVIDVRFSPTVPGGAGPRSR